MIQTCSLGGEPGCCVGNGVTRWGGGELKEERRIPVSRLGCIMYSVMVGLVTGTLRVEIVEENVNAKINQTV